MKGEGIKSILAKVKKALGPIAKEIGPVVLKELIIPFLKKKAGLSGKAGKGSCGGTLKLAGQGNRKRGRPRKRIM
jgi:hypothetical protein